MENGHGPQIEPDSDVFCNCGESFVADAEQEREWDCADSNAYQHRVEAGEVIEDEAEAQL